jgi:penicillin-binding protein 1A
MNKKKLTKKQRERRRLWIVSGLYFAGGCVTLFLLLLVLVFMGTFGRLPRISELKLVNNYTASEVYSSDNYLLGRYYVENRTNTDITHIPEFFIQALIATEDARFYTHHGVDARSTLRVLVKSILLFNKDAGGGSTLSQQLAKNLYPRRKAGILTMPVAKIREIIIARRLEKTYTKSEILQLYLNTVPFGDNTFGVETAALVYFNKKPSKLRPEESATLVGLLKGNTFYNPRTNEKAALERRNLVLDQMVKYNYISRAEADSLQKLTIVLDYRKIVHDEGPAPYFREYLRQELKRWAAENPKADGSNYNIYTDGLKIYTTLDYSLQTYAEEAVNKHMRRLQLEFDKHWKGIEPWKKDPSLASREISASIPYQRLSKQKLSEAEIMQKLKEPAKIRTFTWEGEKTITASALDSILHHFAMLQTGMVCMESKTGFIKVWVGGINYKFFQYDHVTSYRQAGSTFKPVVYAAALEKGVKPCDFYPNDSTVYTHYDDWVPRNSDREYGGFYSVKGALTHSVNTVSAHLLMETGTRDVVQLAESMGMKGDLPEVPSLALGTGTVSLYELVQAYSVFVNRGRKVSPVMIRRIEDQQGNVIFTGGPQPGEEPLISENTAEQILAMLMNVVNNGTAATLRNVYGLSAEMGGKTGTTQNHTDGWFMGITPDLITGVWVGGDNPVIRFRSITYGQGAYMALPIYGNYMQKVYADPVYRSSKTSHFSVSEENWSTLDCPDFREEEFDSIMEFLDKTEESIGSFIRRIFKRKGKTEDPE